MRRGMKFFGGVAGTLVVLAVFVGSAAAAPRDVYRDWADNGRLDRTYTAAELNAARNDTTLQGYGEAGFQPAIDKKLAVLGARSPESAIATTGRSGTLPFTGIDLALLLGGGILLLLVGGGMRRMGRPKPSA
jgi:hypothetical protein